MAEYIERQAASDAVREQLKRIPIAAIRAMDAIQNIPPANVVKVVRCGDCAHYINSRNWCDYHMTKMFKNDFCSFGEQNNDQIPKTTEQEETPAP